VEVNLNAQSSTFTSRWKQIPRPTLQTISRISSSRGQIEALHHSASNTMKQRDGILDLIRGISALLVMLGHLRAFLFIDYTNAGALNPLW